MGGGGERVRYSSVMPRYAMSVCYTHGQTEDVDSGSVRIYDPFGELCTDVHSARAHRLRSATLHDIEPTAYALEVLSAIYFRPSVSGEHLRGPSRASRIQCLDCPATALGALPNPHHSCRPAGATV